MQIAATLRSLNIANTQTNYRHQTHTHTQLELTIFFSIIRFGWAIRFNFIDTGMAEENPKRSTQRQNKQKTTTTITAAAAAAATNCSN